MHFAIENVLFEVGIAFICNSFDTKKKSKFCLLGFHHCLYLPGKDFQNFGFSGIC